MSDGFQTRKKTILIALNSDTPDKSPKGYVDEPLLPLIILINNHQDYVTTSSCSGRICTYLEGLEDGDPEGNSTTATTSDNNKHTTSSQHDNIKSSEKQEDEEEDEETTKGYEENTSLAAVEAAKRAKGGQWLFVSHDPVVFPEQISEHPRWIVDTLFGPEAHRVVLMEEQQPTEMRTIDMARSQLVYFKFEPMILHIEAATPGAAKNFLNHSLFSGYRNSGILPSAKRTMLAIRSTLKLDAPIAYIPSSSPTTTTSSSTSAATAGTEQSKIYLMVTLSYLRVLIDLSNDKFRMNVAQMARFEERLKTHLLTGSSSTEGKKKVGDQGREWEDKDARRERKRREGLLKQEQAAKAKAEKKAAAAAAAAVEAEVAKTSETHVETEVKVEIEAGKST
ncbi:hypothetical protein FBU30_006316 [Linnemannia zychae]|nr:hypothetical protein FBU30_006316 [Linnemannia zychae]